jgi:hypothetical protein
MKGVLGFWGAIRKRTKSIDINLTIATNCFDCQRKQLESSARSISHASFHIVFNTTNNIGNGENLKKLYPKISKNQKLIIYTQFLIYHSQALN